MWQPPRSTTGWACCKSNQIPYNIPSIRNSRDPKATGQYSQANRLRLL